MSTPRTSRRFPLWPAIAVACVAFLVYANTLSNGLVWDDGPQVADNGWIRDLGNIPEMFRTHVAGFGADTRANYYRPMMHVSYALTWALFGPRAWAFHLVNVLLHVLASVLVVGLGARLLRRNTGEPAPVAPVVLAGLLFAVHPIHTEAVSWVAGLPDVAYSAAVLGALLAYLRFDDGREDPASGGGRHRLAYGVAIVCFALALFTKEPAVALPLVLLVREASASGRPVAVRWFALLPFLLVTALYLVARTVALGEFAPLPRHAELSTGQLLLQLPVLFGAYVGKLVLPLGLNAFHVLHPVVSPVDPRLAVGLAVSIAFVAAFAWAFRRDGATLLALALIGIPLLPVLWIPWVGENVFAERYLYLPSAGLALLVARGQDELRSWRGAWSQPVLAALLVACGFLALATVDRNRVWHDELTLWTDTVAGSPDGSLPRTKLADAMLERGDLARAETHYRAALAIEPNNASALNNLALLLIRTGRAGEALEYLERAIAIDPASPQTWNTLGLAHKATGQYPEAIAAYERALELSPDHPGLLTNLARALELAGETRRAAAVRARIESLAGQ